MAIAVMSSSRALLNTSGSFFANPIGTAFSGRSSRVECCAAMSSSNSQVTGSSLRFPASAPVPARLALPLHMIPIPVVEVDEDEEKELTFVDDYDDGRTWLTSQYLSLRLRCSSLMTREASDALRRHFKGREPNVVSVKSMLNATEPENKFHHRHRELNLVSEKYQGNTVKFITDVVLTDNQREYFEDPTAKNTVV